MISEHNQAAFNVGANLAQTYARDWCAMTYAQREAHEFDIMHYIDSEPSPGLELCRLFDITVEKALLAVDVAEWLVCNGNLCDNVHHTDQADQESL